jgi:Asp-tRNA(Asn)/Glu-tRNA(Gln) amidotransferase A subunit family amidase
MAGVGALAVDVLTAVARTEVSWHPQLSRYPHSLPERRSTRPRTVVRNRRGPSFAGRFVDALLERIRTQDRKLHAFVRVYEEEARIAAEATDKAIRSGHVIGPLHGIPIALKDLIEIEGRVTTGGSEVWRNRVSRYTATLAKRLIAAGLIVIGKTRTVEFAMGGWGTNQYRGTPWNPWDPTTARTPGWWSSVSGGCRSGFWSVSDRRRSCPRRAWKAR